MQLNIPIIFSKKAYTLPNIKALVKTDQPDMGDELKS